MSRRWTSDEISKLRLSVEELRTSELSLVRYKQRQRFWQRIKDLSKEKGAWFDRWRMSFAKTQQSPSGFFATSG